MHSDSIHTTEPYEGLEELLEEGEGVVRLAVVAEIAPRGGRGTVGETDTRGLLQVDHRGFCVPAEVVELHSVRPRRRAAATRTVLDWPKICKLAHAFRCHLGLRL